MTMEFARMVAEGEHLARIADNVAGRLAPCAGRADTLPRIRVTLRNLGLWQRVRALG